MLTINTLHTRFHMSNIGITYKFTYKLSLYSEIPAVLMYLPTSFKKPSKLLLMSFLKWNLMIDVKYHHGASYTWPTPSRKKVSFSLVANPSLNYPQISPPMVCTFCSNLFHNFGLIHNTIYISTN